MSIYIPNGKKVLKLLDSMVSLFSPFKLELDNYKGIGVPQGVALQHLLEMCDMNIWQGRVRYYRLKAGFDLETMAKKLGMKNGMSYRNKFEATSFKGYTSVKDYLQICEVLGIDYECIADDYMLFINSNYDELLSKAIELSGLSSKVFAQKYILEYTTLRHSLKHMHKLSPEVAEKYMGVLMHFKLYKG